MRQLVLIFFTFCGAFIAALATTSASAQGTPLAIELLPLGKDIGIKEGQTVTPAYEGWYENEDGSIALSFGFYNRNSEEVLDIPVGPENRIIGAANSEANQGQPENFIPGRHWGVFTVDIPADYNEQVVWHLENQGKTFHIPANRSNNYVIDAIVGDANGNFPPEIGFAEEGPFGHGPGGITVGPIQAKVGEPLTIDSWASDDGKVSGIGAMYIGLDGTQPPVDVAWFKQQGPGSVEFSEVSSKVPSAGGKASTEASFSKAGEYLLRVQVTDMSGPETSGHSQCCWSNSFLKVSVSN